MHYIKRTYLRHFIGEMFCIVIFAILLGSLLYAILYCTNRVWEGYELEIYLITICLFLIVPVTTEILEFKEQWKKLSDKYEI